MVGVDVLIYQLLNKEVNMKIGDIKLGDILITFLLLILIGVGIRLAIWDYILNW